MILKHRGHLEGGLRNADPDQPLRRPHADVKPWYDGVLWTSPADSEWGWDQWCEDEQWGDYGDHARPAHYFALAADASVLTIDSLADLRAIAERYGAQMYPETLTLVLAMKVGIDWPRVMADYDAVHLTAQGQAQTRFSYPIDLYGWDCETVAVFRAADVLEVVPAPTRAAS